MKFANIAGAVYGAVNGGFDIGKAGEAGPGCVVHRPIFGQLCERSRCSQQRCRWLAGV